MIASRDLDAERGFLGALLADPDAIAEHLGLPDGVFQDVACRDVWGAMKRLDAEDAAIDLLSINRALEPASADLTRTTFAHDLTLIADYEMSARNIKWYAAHIVRAWRVRRLRQTCLEAVSILEIGDDDALDVATQKVLDQPTLTDAREPRLLGEVVRTALDDAAAGRYARGATTGIQSLDEISSGLRPGELIVLAGRPSMGKTTLALNILTGACTGPNARPGCLVSLEMSAGELAINLLAGMAGVSALAIRRQTVTSSDQDRLDAAADRLADAPIWIDDDTACRSAPILRSRVRRIAARRGPLALVVIDYLQLVHGGHRRKDDNRNLELGEITAGLKTMAKDLGCAVLALAQLNRGVETRTDKRPRLSDLRDSGAIEQDADQVWLLLRKSYYWPTKPEFQGKAELIVAKNRNGSTGPVELTYDAPSFRFWGTPVPGGGRV